MSANIRSTVVGVFRDSVMADQAMADFKNAGFNDDQIRYSGSSGAGSFLKNLFTGQGTSGSNFENDLANMGLPDEETQYYANEFHNGNSLIAVRAPAREQEAMHILHKNGAYDYSMSHGPAGTTPPVQQPAYMPAGNPSPPDMNRAMQQPNMPPPAPPQPIQQRAAQGGQQPIDTTVRPIPPPQPLQTPVAQQSGSTSNSDAQLQALQTQFQRTQQQLRDAQAQLQAAKQREAQFQVARQRETQLHTMQKQLQDMQAQLQATQAELQATEARIASQYDQSNQ